LPAPDGPPSTAHSPALMENETFATTGRRIPSRRCMVKLLATSETTRGVGMMLDLQDGGNEKLGIRRLRIVKHPVGQTGFNDVAILHHHHPV
jgi:hypothetical protein